jgi:hypothetical protein
VVVVVGTGSSCQTSCTLADRGDVAGSVTWQKRTTQITR